ncbi:PLDc_N domain-containing protein [Hymenobacter lapidiphilus]|uniref:PLD nuclease N-terminal domain-containing protein n=1 Tax=Hymenobacter sp. CCM 8763 TaxID=2303334 RepID=UPI000E344829|nr:PLD nuclease N-terminal domain-containing protein [Hymenobacter sp. CCM 8763]RFP64211.1 PLDc_N domain-containing protein [Hymenobacter sp. CCM 8763]
MNAINTLTKRLPGASLLLSLLTVSLLTSCSRFNNDGSLATWGYVILALDVFALFDIFRQDWGIGKKILWAAIVFLFPLGGLILYFLFAGRGKSST